MKSTSPSRPYRMGARAEAAARTARDVLAATAALWRELPLDEITLERIAERAGVSARTVIRRFGSREGVFSAAIEADAAGIRVERDRVAAGDVDGALDVLLRHYERDGDAVLRTLALEERVEAARAVAAAGREVHRAWCARVFAPFLPAPGDETHRARLDALVAATDLSVWKLLRRDLGRSEDEARAAMRQLLGGLTPPPLGLVGESHE